MAINWTNTRRAAVSKILAAYPKESSKCDEAASAILPHAKQQDRTAATWRLVPRGQDILPFLLLAPKQSVGEIGWTYHVVVETEQHCVDALTNVDGTELVVYLKTHFNHDDQIVMTKE